MKTIHRSNYDPELVLDVTKNNHQESVLKKIIIADLGVWVGHRPNYFRTIIRLFSQKDRNLFIITSNPKAVEDFINSEKILNAQILPIKFNLIEKLVLKSILVSDQIISFFKLDTWLKPESSSQLLQIKFLQRKNNLQDVPVFSTAVIDFMAIVPMFIRPLLFPKKWAGIYVTPWYNTGNIFDKKAKKKRAYGNYAMRLPSCKSIFVIHPDYTRYYRRLLGKNHFYAIPEPISLEVNESFPLASKIKETAAGRFIITLLGGIGKKRNLLVLLDALNLLRNKNWFLVIIGKLQKTDFSESQLHIIDTFFKRYKTQCFIKLDGYITIEPDFNAIISITDLMYLHYHNHPFSSNQLLKSIALRKPVIVNQGGIIASIIKETKWSGMVPKDSEIIAAEIEKFQEKFTIDEEAYTTFIQALDFKNLRTIILNQLENNLSE